MGDWGSTLKMSAEIALSDGTVYPGFVHLQERVPYRNGPETPLDMLDRPDPFLPLTMQGGESYFLSKSQIAVLSCEPPETEADVERRSVAQFLALHVILADGTDFQGIVSLELPPTRRRALDYLNSFKEFFVLWTGSTARYINRAHVRVVRPLD